MKKNKHILIIGVALISLAACQNEAKQPTDAEIDALVEQKVAEVKNNLQQECDNSIMTMAAAKADSILVAEANKPARVITAPAPKPTTTKKATQPTPEPKKETIGNGKPKMGGGNANTVGDGKPKMGGNTDNTQSGTTIGGGKPKMGDK